MNRREFLGTSALVSATTFMSACGSSSDNAEVTQTKPTGAVSLYYEFKIAGPEIANMVSNVNTQATALDAKAGFLGLSLKLMVGDSTMVENLDVSLKGVLKSAYIDAANLGRRPFIYTLYIRFDSYDNLVASGTKDWFSNTIVPQLFAYQPGTPPTKTTLPLAFHQGIYKTVAAGDANGVYTTQADIVTFLKNQKDVATSSYDAIPADGTATSNSASISVCNHVAVDAINTDLVNTKATALLTVAQQTYQPSSNATDGDSGTLSVTDSNYQKAITTEILQNAYTSGETRDYLFHGVWKSVADHENSHIDARFMQAANPVGAYVVSGPWEPLYQTTIVHNKA